MEESRVIYDALKPTDSGGVTQAHFVMRCEDDVRRTACGRTRRDGSRDAGLGQEQQSSQHEDCAHGDSIRGPEQSRQGELDDSPAAGFNSPRRCGEDSYEQGFGENALAKPWLQGPFHNQVHLYPELLAKEVLDFDELKESWRGIELYQDIKVAVWPLLAPEV